MKALTLTQPWATLVAAGLKEIETRSWRTSYRGPLLIHAAKGFPRVAREQCFIEPFKSALIKAGISKPDQLPRGVLLAQVNLTDCLYIDPYGFVLPSEPEFSFGDYRIGRYAWILDRVRQLPKPIPYKGALGLWNCLCCWE